MLVMLEVIFLGSLWGHVKEKLSEARILKMFSDLQAHF